MHDASVVEFMQANFKEKTLEDCEHFIARSLEDSENLHLAIVNDEDEYMGTVSLKSISTDKGVAEFAIAVRKCAMGKGFSHFAIREIISIGKQTCGLRNIYWFVNRANKRAVRFYDKNGYRRVPFSIIKMLLPEGSENDSTLLWYLA